MVYFHFEKVISTANRLGIGGNRELGHFYPLAIGGGCIIASIIGTFFVKLGKSKNIMGALYKGFIVTAVISLILLYPITSHVIGLENTFNVNEKSFTGFDLYYCGIIG